MDISRLNNPPIRKTAFKEEFRTIPSHYSKLFLIAATYYK